MENVFDKNFERKINDIIDENHDDMIKTLRELIAIRSVVEDAAGDKPFGEGVHEAFMYMKGLAECENFEFKNISNYGGHIEFADDNADEDTEIFGILGHIDVVPEGCDWDYEPYAATVEGDLLYGRGAIDDKGPTIAAFYAMKALKDAGFKPNKKIRLILGLDEETNWHGMTEYFKHEPAPAAGFTPDAEFPAIHAEMGILVFELAKKLNSQTEKKLEITSLSGGNAPNMVADHARAVLREHGKGKDPAQSYDYIKAILANYRKETGFSIHCKGMGKSLEITTEGVSAHGARPSSGVNAISVLMGFLGRLDIGNDGMNDFINFYNRHIGFELDGESLGCGFSDAVSGKLILNVGMLNADSKSASITINVRYPVSSNSEEIYDAIWKTVEPLDIGIVRGKEQLPIYFEEDHPMIKTCMEIYQKYSGDTTTKPLVIGGGTYARATKNVIAFGPSFPGEREVAHQKNEFVSLNNLKIATKIYAETIARLSI